MDGYGVKVTCLADVTWKLKATYVITFTEKDPNLGYVPKSITTEIFVQTNDTKQTL